MTPETITRSGAGWIERRFPRARRILVVSDNARMLVATRAALASPALADVAVEYACTTLNRDWDERRRAELGVSRVDVKRQGDELGERFDLVVSAHCKQIFPPALVHRARCVNLHPGLNPHNRGWYPQVFSILNGRPLGATLHEIDEQLDHGAVIEQEQVPLHAWDTSLSAYERVQAAEERILQRRLADVVEGTYVARMPAEEGNVNLLRDFEQLRRLDLEAPVTLGAALDRLRALSHGAFRNAYFVDPATGRRVWVRVELTPDPDPGASDDSAS